VVSGFQLPIRQSPLKMRYNNGNCYIYIVQKGVRFVRNRHTNFKNERKKKRTNQ
jgi:2-hydroxychromene-2-carboxylate isomerase